MTKKIDDLRSRIMERLMTRKREAKAINKTDLNKKRDPVIQVDDDEVQILSAPDARTTTSRIKNPFLIETA